MSNLDNLKKGAEYKGFELLSVFDLSDFHSRAFYLRHKKTGLQVLHLLNDDVENLFSFTFRTPNPESNGAAHILEHSVLCGSEKYPIKDPFICLSNQSVKTYLNAMTYPDHTVFPSSSLAREDYFNLMSVYGDAVFFPRLDPEIFAQEAHRLEVNQEGKASIQGVVYNEMKGNYSSFDSVAGDVAFQGILRGSVYEKDSGGNPEVIPSITREKLLAFHEKWYRPDNCFVFLYGNIPTEDQLDFLQTEFLDRLEKKYLDFELDSKKEREALKAYTDFLTPEKKDCQLEIHAQGPASNGDKLSTVLVSWNLGKTPSPETLTENLIATDVLFTQSGSPVEKALLESGLGEDTAPQTGVESFYNYVLTAGLRGVKEENAEKVRDVIFTALENVAKNGIEKEAVEATLQEFKFSQQEIKRAHGPYALRLMNQPISAWLYGYDVESSFRTRKLLDSVIGKIERNPDFFKDFITERLLKKENSGFFVVTPSQEYSKNRQKNEEALIASLMEKTSVKEVMAQNKKLHDFQSSPDDDSIIPHLRPENILRYKKPLLSVIETQKDSVKGADLSDLHLFANFEGTNGIYYVDILFPVDTLEPKEYELLPLLSEALTDCGWGNLSWSQADRQTALLTGGITSNLIVSAVPDTSASKKLIRQADNDYIGREWLAFRLKMLKEKALPALDLLSDCITQNDFRDTKRLSDVYSEFKNDLDSSVIPGGNEYAVLRAKRKVSRAHAIDEIWNGLSSLYSLRKIIKDGPEKTAERLRNLYEKIRAGGAIVHVTCEKENYQDLKERIGDFAKKTNLTALKAARDANTADFIELTELPSKSNGKSSAPMEICLTSSEVGFAASASPASSFGDDKCPSEDVCCHWLSNNLLWERLRTIGGAYGAYCYTDTISKIMIFASYRDPTPAKSIEVFIECLNEASKIDFSDSDIEKTVVGTYSSLIQPRSPAANGSTGLMRTLYAITDKDRMNKIVRLLKTKREDVKNSFAFLYERAKKSVEKSIIVGNNSDLTGNIVNLPV